MNDTKNKKITLLQAFLIYIVATYTPFIRYVTKMAITHAHQAAWLSCLASMVLFIPLLFVLYKVTLKFEGQSFHDILSRVFGRFISKSLCFIYIIWLIILLALYIKYASEKLTSSMYVYTDINLIMFLLVAFVGITLRWGLQVFERMNKIIFVLCFSQFIIVLTFLLYNFSIKNVTPISTIDIIPLFKSTIYVLTVSVYITFLFIFNDKIEYRKKNFSRFAFIAIFITVASSLIILSVLGTFGSDLAVKVTFPFLSAVKSITIFNASASLDSLMISIWMIAEFVTAALFTYCISRLIKNVFNLKSETPALTAILGLSYYFAIYLSNDVFELIVFSQTIAVVANLALGLIVPFVLYFTAKVRKLV